MQRLSRFLFIPKLIKKPSFRDILRLRSFFVSQPKVYGPDEHDPLGYPLVNRDQLIQIFINAERTKADCMMGIEYEVFGQINGAMVPMPYEGAVSITALFEHLAHKSQGRADPLLPIREGHHIVALNCNRAIIALEPGGQLEIAARPHHSLRNVVESFSNIVQEIEEAAGN